MEKEEIKNKVLDALWLLNQKAKGNKDRAKDLLHQLFVNL